MSYFTPCNPGYTSEIRAPAPLGAMPMGARKAIARRALLEVEPARW
jgi:acyl CoA:acetate/3-ketoacid CoA transferase